MSNYFAKQAAKDYPFGLSFNEVLSIWITVGMTAIAIAILSFAYYVSPPHKIIIALSAGAVGGFLHEFIQSKGKVLFIQKEDDGIYLGSISGLILGIVAGILVLVQPLSAGGLGSIEPNAILIEAFLAGLALKGVGEAATSMPQSSDKFSVVGAKLVSVAAANDELKITITNSMSSPLKIQAINVLDKDAGNQALIDTNIQVIGPKKTESKQIKTDNSLIPGTSYTVNVISLNGQEKLDFVA